ncbi:hypothetical protein, partial [Burkholderia pseudomallei]|uniref:hypothetical protein n=1 Tax=Burkholderia pseudomallei TaxID=28450 RepID=UPI001F166A66
AASTTRSRRTRNPDPRKTKPHAHKNVGFVSNLRQSTGLPFCFEPPFPPTVAAAVTVGSRNAALP